MAISNGFKKVLSDWEISEPQFNKMIKFILDQGYYGYEGLRKLGNFENNLVIEDGEVVEYRGPLDLGSKGPLNLGYQDFIKFVDLYEYFKKKENKQSVIEDYFLELVEIDNFEVSFQDERIIIIHKYNSLSDITKYLAKIESIIKRHKIIVNGLPDIGRAGELFFIKLDLPALKNN
jgi:hypothetical protein